MEMLPPVNSDGVPVTNERYLDSVLELLPAYFFLIVIFTRQEHAKSVIISTVEGGSIFKGPIYPI